MLLPRYSVVMIVHQSGLMFVGDDENNDNNKCRQRHIIIVVMYGKVWDILFATGMSESPAIALHVFSDDGDGFALEAIMGILSCTTTSSIIDTTLY